MYAITRRNFHSKSNNAKGIIILIVLHIPNPSQGRFFGLNYTKISQIKLLRANVSIIAHAFSVLMQIKLTII